MRRAAESHQLFVRRRSEAQSTVEVALSLPVVMLVFVMLLQGALYMHALNVVRSAAQEGARAAAAEGATLADGEAHPAGIFVDADRQRVASASQACREHRTGS